MTIFYLKEFFKQYLKFFSAAWIDLLDSSVLKEYRKQPNAKLWVTCFVLIIIGVVGSIALPFAAVIPAFKHCWNYKKTFIEKL
jgi:hypothetical protein